MKRKIIICSTIIPLLIISMIFYNLNSRNIQSSNNEEIEILLEKKIHYHGGMPGPDGKSNDSGSDILICNDGSIYRTEDPAYYASASYPLAKNLQEMLSHFDKIDKQVTKEDLELIKKYIDNIQGDKEELKEKENKIEYVAADAPHVSESIVIYNTQTGEQFNIGSYTSLSIENLMEIVNKYV